MVLVALHGDDAPARAVDLAIAEDIATPTAVAAFIPILGRVVAQLAGELRRRGLSLPMSRRAAG